MTFQEINKFAIVKLKFLLLLTTTLNPAINRGAIRPDSALCRHLLEAAAADPVSAMPSRGPKYDLAAKMPSLEITRDLLPPTLPRGRCPINLLFATEPMPVPSIRAIFRLDQGS